MRATDSGVIEYADMRITLCQMSLTVGDVVALPVVQAGDPEVLSRPPMGRTAPLGARQRPRRPVGAAAGRRTGADDGCGAGEAHRESTCNGLATAGAIGVVVELGTSGRRTTRHSPRPSPRTSIWRWWCCTVRSGSSTSPRRCTARIVADQYDEVAFDRRVHETFTELSMRRASVGGIVDAAARMLDEPVVLEDLTHQALAVSARARATAHCEDWERRSRRARGPRAGAEQWAVDGGRPAAEEWGRLIVPASPADPAARRWCSSGRPRHSRCTA